MTAEPESKTYQQMLNSVEQILSEISSDKIDLDEMIEKVEKGYYLLKQMNTRLDSAKDKITQLKNIYETKENKE